MLLLVVMVMKKIHASWFYLSLIFLLSLILFNDAMLEAMFRQNSSLNIFISFSLNTFKIGFLEQNFFFLDIMITCFRILKRF